MRIAQFALLLLVAAQGCGAGFDDLTAYVERACAELKLKGAAVIIGRADGTILYRHFFGTYTAATTEPVASVGKWWTAATMETLREKKRIDLDRPIGAYLADVPRDKAAITIRQTLSHTSGLTKPTAGGTLAETARHILSLPLTTPPGSTFRYNGSAMMVAGLIAEQVTGTPWAELFRQALIEPLDLHQTAYIHPEAPSLSGGITTSADDLARFLAMLVNDGQSRGRAALTAESIRDMEHNVAGGAAQFRSYTGGPLTMVGYNTGNWCELAEADGNCLRASSYGANGTYPWIDRKRRIFGVFFVKDNLARDELTFKTVREMAERIVDAYPMPQVPGLSKPSSAISTR